MKLPHQLTDIAAENFQRLEDLATAYWYSEVLFTSLQLDIFGLLADSPATVDRLAARTGYDPDGLSRFLDALVALGLVVEFEGLYSNGPLASRFLTRGNGACLEDFLLYRRYLSSHWQRLGSRIRDGVRANERPADEPLDSYRERTLAYVRALDLQARLKADESLEYLKAVFEHGWGDAEEPYGRSTHADPGGSPGPRRLLDAGGGAGAWSRALQRLWPGLHSVLLELPDTIWAARKLYPHPESWHGIETVAGSILTPCIGGREFDLVLLSNVIHAYGPEEAKGMVKRFAACLAPGGTLLVHDYLADMHGVDPVKGALYDLHMLVNTYNGRVYRLEEMIGMLNGAGLKNVRFFHLQSDTSIFLAKHEGCVENRQVSDAGMLAAHAKRLGFSFARVIEADRIAIEPWVPLKCRFGCPNHGISLSCPPASLDEEKMAAVVSRYRRALLVQGVPPAREFHERLLAVEKAVFLAGYPEALAFGAGPCPVCTSCPEDGRCRFPEKARPSLEACGVDVYETARMAGLALRPVSHRQGYVKYVGVVLFDKKESNAGSACTGRLNA
jgi:predicted metal-binding protein